MNRCLWSIESNRIYMDAVETIILPSLPALALSLMVPISVAQYTVSAFLFGKLITKFLVSADFVERRDKKQVLIYFLIISILGSLIALIPNVKLIIGGRIVQGIGVGCVTSISTALVSEHIEGPFLKTWTTIGLVNVWVPMLASLVGGVFQVLIGWQANFIFLFVLGIICVCLTAYYIPSSPAKIKSDEKIRHAYSIVLKRPAILGEIISFSLIYSGQAVIYTVTPFLFIQAYHWPAHLYWIVLLIFSVGLFFGKFLVQQFHAVVGKSFSKMAIMLLAVLASASLCFLPKEVFLSVPLVLFLICIYGFSQSVFSPLVKDNIKKHFKDHVSTGVAFLGIFQSFSAATLALIMSKYFHHEPKDIGFILLVISLSALIIFSGGCWLEKCMQRIYAN